MGFFKDIGNSLGQFATNYVNTLAPLAGTIAQGAVMGLTGSGAIGGMGGQTGGGIGSLIGSLFPGGMPGIAPGILNPVNAQPQPQPVKDEKPVGMWIGLGVGFLAFVGLIVYLVKKK